LAELLTTETYATDLRSLRLAAKLAFSDCAEKFGVEEGDLKRYERGFEMPPRKLLNEASALFGVKVSEIKAAHEKLTEAAIPGEGYATAKPAESFVVERKEKLNKSVMPILDLFCGTGGFSHGFEQTNEFQVSCGIDLLGDRVQTFSANHPSAKAVCADLRTLSTSDLLSDCPVPEVVIGGPPCQGFSSIRPFRTLTEMDARNHLFENFALVVREARPRWFVMENVVGMLTNQNGRVMDAVLQVFRELDYKTSWRILNAANYGLPQRRERLIVVGSREGKDFRWPEPTHVLQGARSMAGKRGQRVQQSELFGAKTLPLAVSVMEAIHDLPPLRSGEASTSYAEGVEPTPYERMMRGRSKKLTLHEATLHSEKMLNIIRHAGFSKAALPDGMVTSGFSTCYSRLEPNLPSVTITVNFVHPASNKCIHPVQDRALTPREGARLQGFPDNFEFVGSRAQVVKQIGNAVPPVLGKVIAEALLRSI
jgi:DNA (cytosine-5)-methyltransferase 1